MSLGLSPTRTPALAWCAVWTGLCIALPLVTPSRATAQVQALSPELSTRFGFERMAGQDGSASGPTPLMVEAAIRLWTDEEASVLWGGGLRAELGGAGGIGLVPRVEYRHILGALELRPGIALPVFLAPLTMFGPEASAGVRYPINRFLGVTGYLAVTAFLFGSDVPKGATLVQITGGLGVDLVL